jgi:hypothetical protein
VLHIMLDEIIAWSTALKTLRSPQPATAAART